MARVLVVDDESDIRQAVTEILADEGYQVAGARDGAEALAQARSFHPQLVLLDLMMPGMNGWDFLEVHRVDPELRAIPVIVLSALGRERNVDAQGFIEKPFELDELLSAVRRHAAQTAA